MEYTCLFETRASYYELKSDSKKFTLTKTALKEGMTSPVPVGFSIKSPYVSFTEKGGLKTEDMQTSPIVNKDDVRLFLSKIAIMINGEFYFPIIQNSVVPGTERWNGRSFKRL